MNWVLQEHTDCCLCGHPRTSLSMRTERTVLGLGEAGQVVPQQGVRRTRDPRPYSWACALLLTHRSWVCVHTLFLSRVALGFIAKFALQPVRIPYTYRAAAESVRINQRLQTPMPTAARRAAVLREACREMASVGATVASWGVHAPSKRDSCPQTRSVSAF